MHRTPLVRLTLLLAASLALPAYSHAQSTLFGGRSGATSGTGTGATGGGFGATGQSGQAGQSGTAFSGPQFGNTGQLSQSVGQGAIIGQQNNNGRVIGTRQTTGQTGANGNRNTQNRNGAGGRNAAGNRNGANRTGAGANQARGANRNANAGNTGGTDAAKRPQFQQHIAFPYGSVSTAGLGDKVAARLGGRIGSQSATTASRGLTVDVDDAGVATLRGQFDSQDQLRLAEALVRLEPGVRKVVTDAVVAGQEP